MLLNIFFVVSLNAEPTPSVKWLIDEPASLFDIGMMRMRNSNKTRWIPALMNKIKGLKLKLSDPGSVLGVGSVVYDFDENIITITVSLIGNPTEQMCANILKKYKDIIAPPMSFGSYPRLTIALTSCFGHVNYSVARRPEDLDDNILKIIKVTVGISEKQGWAEGKTIYCSSGLFDDTPSFTKFGF